MAIAHDSSSTAQANNWTTNSTSVTWAHTCTGTDRVLIVGALAYNSASIRRRVSGVTYNGVALTKLTSIDGEENPTTPTSCELWYLIAPATGSNNIVVTLDGQADYQYEMAVSYTGVKQTGTVDSSNTGTSGATTSYSLATTTVNNNTWLVGFWSNRGGTPTAQAGTTQRQTNTGTQGAIADSNGAKTPAGSYSLGFTQASGVVLGMCIASITPSEGFENPSSGKNFLMFM